MKTPKNEILGLPEDEKITPAVNEGDSEEIPQGVLVDIATRLMDGLSQQIGTEEFNRLQAERFQRTPQEKN